MRLDIDCGSDNNKQTIIESILFALLAGSNHARTSFSPNSIRYLDTLVLGILTPQYLVPSVVRRSVSNDIISSSILLVRPLSLFRTYLVINLLKWLFVNCGGIYLSM